MTVRVGYSLFHEGLDAEAPEPFLDAAAETGVDTVELPLFALRLVLDGRPLTGEIAGLARRLAGYPFGITVHGHIAVNLMSPPGEVARHVEMARCNIEVAAALGAERLVLHCGLFADDPGLAVAARAAQREHLARLGDAAAAAGILLCVETTTVDPGQRTLLAGELAEDIAAVGHDSVLATLDFAHVALECARRGVDPFAEVARILPLAAHVHLNDCFGRPCPRDALMPAEALAFGLGDLHLPIGMGSLDWDRYLALPGYRDDAILNLELHYSHWHHLGDSIERLRGFAARIEPARARPASARS